MKKPINPFNSAVSNCTNPLKLTWNETTSQYKVNKPYDQSGTYVSKHIADALFNELVALKKRMVEIDPDFNIPSLNEVIFAAIEPLK